jgi:S-adenosylmethionine-diacylglycerol 3-amino-3-carboxypropyl transferase
MKKDGQSHLPNRFIMNKIDFYTCWDDIAPIQQALQINSDDIVFSITSGGCNILNLLLYDPKKIIAVDYNPYQNYLLELKIAAIKNLSHSELLKFMGIAYSNEREELYGSIRKNLSKNACTFWDSNSHVVDKGILNVGEQNVKIFGNFLRFLKGKKTIEKFFYCKTIDEQTHYFYKHIFGLPWKLALFYPYNNYLIKLKLILLMLRECPHRQGKFSEFFRYLRNVHYPKDHLKKIEDIFTKIPITNNYFASLIFLGRYINENCVPPYLLKENYSLLNQKLDRIEIKTSSVYEALKKLPDESITKFNLSNIFDWTDDNEFKNQLIEIIRIGRNNGKIFYSTTRNDRNIPEDLKSLNSDKQLAIQLPKKDRTIMYSNFGVGKISK